MQNPHSQAAAIYARAPCVAMGLISAIYVRVSVAAGVAFAAHLCCAPALKAFFGIEGNEVSPARAGNGRGPFWRGVAALPGERRSRSNAVRANPNARETSRTLAQADAFGSLQALVGLVFSVMIGQAYQCGAPASPRTGAVAGLRRRGSDADRPRGKVRSTRERALNIHLAAAAAPRPAAGDSPASAAPTPAFFVER